MKKRYLTPALEVSAFSIENIVVTSGLTTTIASMTEQGNIYGASGRVGTEFSVDSQQIMVNLMNN